MYINTAGQPINSDRSINRWDGGGDLLRLSSKTALFCFLHQCRAACMDLEDIGCIV